MALEENIQKLRDSLAVTSAQTLRHEAMLKDHAAWLHSHDLAMIAHEEWLKAHEEAVAQHDREMAEIRENGRKVEEHIDQIAKIDAERGRVLDERIANLVSAIGKMISEGNGKG
jgi:hypothetical protein